MPKYKMEIILEFEATNNLPEIYLKGTAHILENAFDNIASPDDLNWDTSVGIISLKQV